MFVAGGVGITPVMSMLGMLADRGDRRPQLLVYGARTWDETPFREELDALPEALALRLVFTLSDQPPGVGPARRARVTTAMLDRYLDAERKTSQVLRLRSGADDGRH